jgi:hypothetical protein
MLPFLSPAEREGTVKTSRSLYKKASKRKILELTLWRLDSRLLRMVQLISHGCLRDGMMDHRFLPVALEDGAIL